MKTTITQKKRRAVALIAGAALIFSAIPASASAKDLEISGWIPYWTTSAPRAAEKHLDEIDMIHPFGYSIKNDGTLSDNMKITKGSWKRLISKARREDVLVVPSITTSNGPLVHVLLANDEFREEHIKEIVDLVEDRDFDGIDIDYEGKLSLTHDVFATFLTELNKALDDKILSCTVEARTPPSSLYRTIPPTIAYANDYKTIADVCDRVNIMAYDQQRADIKENDANKGAPYVPVADVDWVRKVLDITLDTIPADKLVLGIPSYGHEYEVLVTPQQYAEYRRVNAYNIPGIESKMDDKDVEAGRVSSGELGFTYLGLGKHAPQYRTSIPRNTPEHLKAAAESLAYTNATNIPSVFNYVTWSDAGAMKDKIDLAKEFDLRGVALFKIDGQEDRGVWKELD